MSRLYVLEVQLHLKHSVYRELRDQAIARSSWSQEQPHLEKRIRCPRDFREQEVYSLAIGFFSYIYLVILWQLCGIVGVKDIGVLGKYSLESLIYLYYTLGTDKCCFSSKIHKLVENQVPFLNKRKGKKFHFHYHKNRSCCCAAAINNNNNNNKYNNNNNNITLIIIP